MEGVNNFIDQLPMWIPIITMVITAAAAVAAVTPSKKDDSFMATVMKLINILGLNVGKAQNKGE